MFADLDGEAVRGDGDGLLILREEGDVRDAGTERVQGGVGAREFEARVGVGRARDLCALVEGCGWHRRVRARDEGLCERMYCVCEMIAL